ncbi:MULTISPECIES: peptidoglycan DD-metalloendopeptidase family protein [unclassified Streptomyces]|uniref:murein hydrolase activator EnvC family protein n=1 Tax=unclassified Streptomyces TaxID=2593676 RepID=UPI001EF104A2|nr:MULTISPECIES: peptidoglycan DD-metalloendopeptidase family protein [unclassified Streptomyces]
MPGAGGAAEAADGAVPARAAPPTGGSVPTGDGAQTGGAVPDGGSAPTGDGAQTGEAVPDSGAVPTGGGAQVGEAVPDGGSAPVDDSVPAGGSVPAVGRNWPVGARSPVLRGWEPPATPYGPGHRGVDLGAPPGTPVRAVAAGRVFFAGPVAGRGVVSVELSGTGEPPLRTTYEPVRASVREGERVAAGQIVGTVQGAGPASGSHCGSGCLHWGLRRGEAYLDPLLLLPPWLLRTGPSRLLPVPGAATAA